MLAGEVITDILSRLKDDPNKSAWTSLGVNVVDPEKLRALRSIALLATRDEWESLCVWLPIKPHDIYTRVDVAILREQIDSAYPIVPVTSPDDVYVDVWGWGYDGRDREWNPPTQTKGAP